MRRILKTLIGCALILAVAWVIASLPGRLSIDAGPYTVETSDSIAVTALLLAFVVLYLLIRLVMLILFRFGGEGGSMKILIASMVPSSATPSITTRLPGSRMP